MPRGPPHGTTGPAMFARDGGLRLVQGGNSAAAWRRLASSRKYRRLGRLGSERDPPDTAVLPSRPGSAYFGRERLAIDRLDVTGELEALSADPAAAGTTTMDRTPVADAALGGDEWGARQVNLEPGDRPADVYSAVANLVKESLEHDLKRGNPYAKILDGKITRKVVKQTVMTNVYGVTFVRAKAQVRKQLLAAHPDLPNTVEMNPGVLSS